MFDRGNPWVKFESSVPVPVKTRTPHHGYGFRRVLPGYGYGYLIRGYRYVFY